MRFRYRAGQHVELRTPGVGKPRTYSIANAPDREGLAPDGLLEFFITRHPHGQASGWLHGPERLGGPLALHGPYGSFHLPTRRWTSRCCASPAAPASRRCSRSSARRSAPASRGRSG